MITTNNILEGMPEYLEFAYAFGRTSIEGSNSLLKYLGVDPDIIEHVRDNFPNKDAAAGWIYGFSFALWYLNTKLDLVVPPND